MFNFTPIMISEYLMAECLIFEEEKEKRYIGRYFGFSQKVMSKKARYLAGSVSASQSTISGTGATSFEINTSVTIKLTAKDSTGTNIGVGNDIFYIQITNACTKGVNFECVADVGAESVLASNINTMMMDNLDGTYSYNYLVTRPGIITIAIILYSQGAVYSEFFPNTALTGNTVSSGISWSNIDLTSGTNNVYPGNTDYLSGNFYFKFKAPITGTLTFTVFVDDEVSMTVDGTLILSRICCGYISGTVSVVLNQYYDAHMTYVNGPGYSSLIMSWSYPGQTDTVVPSTSLYYPVYVLNTPFNVVVTCPANSVKVISGGIPQCSTDCGNGKRDGTEECDDGNNMSSDGCSSSCTIESGYACTGGSSTTKDICSKIIPTPVPTPSPIPAKPSVYIISSSNLWMGYFVWTSVFICLLIDLLMGLMTDRYPTGIYITIEHIQLLSILPITGSYFTKIVKGYFRMMCHSLLGFNFINFKSLYNISINYTQSNETLEYLGFELGSSIINISGFISIGICMLLLEMIIFRSFRFLPRPNRKCTKLINTCINLRNWACIGLYIRYLILGFLLVIISTMDEINNFSSTTYLWSWCLSLVILVLCSVFFAIPFVIWCWASEGEEQSGMFSEFTSMLKPNVASKLYLTLFLLHRILICIAFCINNQLDLINKIIFLICVQGVYLILLCLIRPYNTIKANITKIICETSVFVIVVLMYVYQNSSDWIEATEAVFLYTMMCSSCIPCLISIFFLFPMIINSKQNKKRNVHIHPTDNDENIGRYIDDGIHNNQITMIEETKINEHAKPSRILQLIGSKLSEHQPKTQNGDDYITTRKEK